MWWSLLDVLPAQVEDLNSLSNLLQKGGLAAVASIFIVVSVILYRSKEDKADKHAAELKALNEEHKKAMADIAEKNRASEEAKNEKIVGFVGKLTEVVSANTAALERLTETVDKLDRRS